MQLTTSMMRKPSRNIFLLRYKTQTLTYFSLRYEMSHAPEAWRNSPKMLASVVKAYTKRLRLAQSHAMTQCSSCFTLSA